MIQKEEKISEEVKKLVIFRLKTIPPNFKLSVGDYGAFNKEELIKHVSEGDKMGKEIIRMQMEFLRSLKTGRLSKLLTENV